MTDTRICFFVVLMYRILLGCAEGYFICHLKAFMGGDASETGF